MKKGGNPRTPIPNADDDLVLFRDMQTRDKVSLLQPIPTDDVESNSGNFPLFRIASAKKFGFDFLLHENEKNDYDWLKTPPATPLFASLEIDAGAPDLLLTQQRELPIMAHLSRFSGTTQTEASKRSKSPNPMEQKAMRSLGQHMNLKASSGPLVSSSNTIITSSGTRGFSDETPPNLITTNRSTSTTRGGRPTTPSSVSSRQQQPIETHHSTSTTRGRGRPTTPSTKTTNVNRSTSTSKGRPGNSFLSPPKHVVTASDETPSNLVTNRPLSTSRSRPNTPSMKKQDPIHSKRQSCSPSMSRGRKIQDPNTLITTKKKNHQALVNGGSLAFGSSMVEKVMNARRLVGQDSERKPKYGATIIDHSGFGRFMSKSSIDLADLRNKQTESKQDHVKLSHSNPTSAEQSRHEETKTQEIWRRKETRRFSKT